VQLRQAEQGLFFCGLGGLFDVRNQTLRQRHPPLREGSGKGAADGPAAKQQRFLAPLLYQTLPAGGPLGGIGCMAIQSGNNASQPDPGIGYQATGEFSAVTGWGIPDDAKLLAALTAMPWASAERV
jgi:hypothetical protein